MKTKFGYVFIILGFFSCSNNVGITQAEIEDNFDLSTAANPTILDVDETEVCPHFEFDSDNTDTFLLLIEDGNPVEKQTIFEYAETTYEVDGDLRVLSSENAVGSTFELKYNPELATYSINVNYNCAKIDDNLDCTNTIFNCTGPLQ